VRKSPRRISGGGIRIKIEHVAARKPLDIFIKSPLIRVVGELDISSDLSQRGYRHLLLAAQKLCEQEKNEIESDPRVLLSLSSRFENVSQHLVITQKKFVRSPSAEGVLTYLALIEQNSTLPKGARTHAALGILETDSKKSGKQ
jgi:hypothetical protein